MSSTITLVDNTASRHLRDGGEPSPPTSSSSRGLTTILTRSSVKEGLAKRKYRKWQPRRLGITEDHQNAENLSASERVPTGNASRRSHQVAPSVESADFAVASGQQDVDGDANVKAATPTGSTRRSELDILYENQRGSFFFGVPLYSHSSLLNFDPSAWMTPDMKESPVDITNAQVPDPSWDWAWKTWYVDMSGDVDEQGWQYSFTFASKSWHGTHPWFHSFVRRRRWLRLRVKRANETSRGRSGFEMAHRLNQDYFTIHSSTTKMSPDLTAQAASRSASLTCRTPNTDEEVLPEEIEDIPTLMGALKSAVVDREKIEALKTFIDEGGEELHYLQQKVPDIMSLFVFQTSRWRFLDYMLQVIDELSHQIAETEGTKADELERKRQNLMKAADSARQQIAGPEVVRDAQGKLARTSRDLSRVLKQDGLLSSHRPCEQRGADQIDLRDRIKGVPNAAEIEREGHIH